MLHVVSAWENTLHLHLLVPLGILFVHLEALICQVKSCPTWSEPLYIIGIFGEYSLDTIVYQICILTHRISTCSFEDGLKLVKLRGEAMQVSLQKH
jgi:hypothetical protein